MLSAHGHSCAEASWHTVAASGRATRSVPDDRDAASRAHHAFQSDGPVDPRPARRGVNTPSVHPEDLLATRIHAAQDARMHGNQLAYEDALIDIAARQG